MNANLFRFWLLLLFPHLLLQVVIRMPDEESLEGNLY